MSNKDTKESSWTNFRSFQPPALLKPAVRNYWTARGTLEANRELRVIPDGCIDIVVSRNSSTASFTARIVGTMTRPLMETKKGFLEYLGVRFNPGGFSQFFPCSASEFTDRLVPLENLSGCSSLHRQINQTENLPEVLEHLETYLMDHYRQGSQDTELANLFAEIESSRWDGRLSDFVAIANYSERQLRRKFNEQIGVSPKMFCRIARFKNALKALRKPDHQSTLGIALDAGYYDQAHFTNDFTAIIGVSPLEYASK